MSMSFEKETARAKSRDGQPKSSFSGEIRNLDSMPLAKGDSFVIPNTFEVFPSKRFNNAEYILVTCDNGKIVQFFPSIFTKQRTIANDDMTYTDQVVRTSGTATELFNNSTDVDSGMNSLKGKKIVVSDMHEVQTLNYDRNRLVKAQIPVLDLA